MLKISSSTFPLTRWLVSRLPDFRSRPLQLGVSSLLLILILTGLWPLLFLLVPPVALLLAIHWAPRFVLQNFCRDVWLDGEELVVQCAEQRFCIPLSQVQQITWHGSNNPPRARIRLKSEGSDTTVYTFIPDLSAGRVQARKMIENLHQRITAS
jgi:hypothetical protein